MGTDDQSIGGRSVRSSSVVSSKTKKKRITRKKKAKQWTYYVETLKRTIDCLYEICRKEQSIDGCKEASLYLSGAQNDFLSLIEAINLEVSYEKEDRPQSISWEIRKSMNSPSNNVQDKGSPSLIDVLPMSPMVMNDLSLSIKQRYNKSENDGWQLVTGKRRRSTSSATSDIPDGESEISNTESLPTRTPTVYERLSGSTYSRKQSVPQSSSPALSKPSRNVNSKLTCPKSAMDLPQTRASMAKMSYCRQRLWEKDVQPSLAEKLKAKQRREREREPIKCGLNFADPAAVRKSALEMKEKKKLLQGRPQKCATDSHARSLQSICENGEADGDIVPADPAPSKNSTKSLCNFPLELENDQEWREITEEEESLAMEERSITLEMEKAESELESMDAELIKQVNDEAAECERQDLCSSPDPSDSAEILKKIEESFKNFCHVSWSELVEKEFAGNYRDPGTIVHRHEKLCSPNRRRPELSETDLSQRHVDKLKRANDIRERLQAEKKQKVMELAQRREEVRAKRMALNERKRIHIEHHKERIYRAQENRERNITEIVRKAKEDSVQKVLEVQLINSLHDDNKKFELKKRDAGVEERIQSIAEERAKKAEEKISKEHAAEERRKNAEKIRVARLVEMNVKKEARTLKVAAERSIADQQKKERRLKNTGKDKPALPSDHPLLNYWHSTDNTGLSKMITSNDSYYCEKCSIQLFSPLHALGHVISENHYGSPNISFSDICKDIESLLSGVPTCLAPDNTESSRSIISELRESGAILRETISYYSPNVSKKIGDLKGLLRKIVTNKKCDEMAHKSFERIVTEVLKSFPNESSDTAIGLTDVAGDLLKVAFGSFTNTRLEQKVTSLVLLTIKNERFATSCLISDSFEGILEKCTSVDLNENAIERLVKPFFEVLLALFSAPRTENKNLLNDRLELVDRLVNCFFVNCVLRRKDSTNVRTVIPTLFNILLRYATTDSFRTKYTCVIAEIFLDYYIHRQSESDSSRSHLSKVDSTSVLSILHFISNDLIIWNDLLSNPVMKMKVFICIHLMCSHFLFHFSSCSTEPQCCEHLFVVIKKFASFSSLHKIACSLDFRGKSLLEKLCSFPLQYFIRVPTIFSSMPCFITLTRDSLRACNIFSKRASLLLLINFIKTSKEAEDYKVCLETTVNQSEWNGILSFYESVKKI